MVKIVLPDGSSLEVHENTTAKELAQQIGPGLAKSAIAAKLNGQLTELSSPIIAPTDGSAIQAQIITLKDSEGLDIMRHSCAHIMAEAICSIWPDARLVYGPIVENGFYYDIDLDESIRPDDFKRIEQKMAEIVKAEGNKRDLTMTCVHNIIPIRVHIHQLALHSEVCSSTYKTEYVESIQRTTDP